MKAQTKAIVASVIIIALALTAISGVTYSWFSDTETSDISITTGTVDVKATSLNESNVTLNDNDVEIIGLAAGFNGSYDIKVENLSTLNTDIKLSLFIDPMTLLDYDLKNIIIKISGNSSSLSTEKSLYDLGVRAEGSYTILAVSLNNVAPILSDDKTIDTYSVVLSTPEEYGDNPPSGWSQTVAKNLEMSILVQAVQHGGDVSPITMTTTGGSATETISGRGYSASGLQVGETSTYVNVNVLLSDSALNTTGVSGSTLDVKVSNSAEESGFSINDGTVVTLKVNNNGVKFDGYVTVTVSINDAISNPSIVYTGTMQEGYDHYLIDSYISNGNTIITFKTNHFSEFIVSDNVKVSTAEAFAKTVTQGGNVSITNDITVNQGFLIDNDLNINLKGHTITVTDGVSTWFNQKMLFVTTDENANNNISITNGKITLTSDSQLGLITNYSTGNLSFSDLTITGTTRIFEIFGPSTCTIDNINVSTSNKECLYMEVGSFIVKNSTFSTTSSIPNYADTAVSFSIQAKAIMENCKMHGNSTTARGAYIYNSGADVTLIDCEITSNSSDAVKIDYNSNYSNRIYRMVVQGPNTIVKGSVYSDVTNTLNNGLFLNDGSYSSFGMKGNGYIHIAGGSYDTDPSTKVIAGYHAVHNNDLWIVKEYNSTIE